MTSKLEIVPCSLRDAIRFVELHHRHSRAPRGGIFAAALALAGEVVGVVIVGRPVARGLQDGFTAEVTRLCLSGETPNGASKLYGAAWRAARAIGYRRLITYTLATEAGTSLRAAGFRVVAEVRGRSWHCPSRPRVDHQPAQDRIRWEMTP